jgi:hypothetical protein
MLTPMWMANRERHRWRPPLKQQTAPIANFKGRPFLFPVEATQFTCDGREPGTDKEAS